jgi:hypothetical protein
MVITLFLYVLYIGGRRSVGLLTRKHARCRSSSNVPERSIMMDFIFIATIVAFFAVTVGLVRFCAGLMSKGGRP